MKKALLLFAACLFIGVSLAQTNPANTDKGSKRTSKSTESMHEKNTVGTYPDTTGQGSSSSDQRNVEIDSAELKPDQQDSTRGDSLGVGEYGSPIGRGTGVGTETDQPASDNAGNDATNRDTTNIKVHRKQPPRTKSN